MAEKNAINSALITAAVAKVKEQKTFTGAWGVGEHLACMRYVAVDAINSASGEIDAWKKKPENAGKPEPKVGEWVNGKLKAAFASDPEFAYASNFQKLLIKAKEIQAGSSYE